MFLSLFCVSFVGVTLFFLGGLHISTSLSICFYIGMEREVRYVIYDNKFLIEKCEMGAQCTAIIIALVAVSHVLFLKLIFAIFQLLLQVCMKKHLLNTLTTLIHF